MLDQSTVDRLLAIAKKLADMGTIVAPSMGTFLELNGTDATGRELFKFDVNRKGKLKPGKCTYQNRYQQTEILLRVDIDGPPHDNPDGETIPCPHLHIYREGYADGWAVPLPTAEFPSPTDIAETLIHFLKYCKVTELPEVQRSLS